MEIDSLIQLLLGLLCTGSFGLGAWALKAVVELSKEQARHKERTDLQHDHQQALLDAHRREVDRQIMEARSEQSRQFTEVKTGLGEVKNGVTAVHKRIDDLMKGKDKHE